MEDFFGPDVAARYDEPGDPMFAAPLLERTAGFLAELAGAGPALEFAIGTGRVALPLAARGVPVTGIEFSAAMLDQLRAKPGSETLTTLVGDMATTRVPDGQGRFSLVYLVFNTIGNLTTQAQQVDCFANAAWHLAPGGHFVIEVGVPQLQRLPLGERYVPFSTTPEHVGIDEYDVVEQGLVSHHYSRGEDGRMIQASVPFRYVWPNELDLMARMAGLERTARYADWDRSPFTGTSPGHVSVWSKPS